MPDPPEVDIHYQGVLAERTRLARAIFPDWDEEADEPRWHETPSEPGFWISQRAYYRPDKRIVFEVDNRGGCNLCGVKEPCEPSVLRSAAPFARINLAALAELAGGGGTNGD